MDVVDQYNDLQAFDKDDFGTVKLWATVIVINGGDQAWCLIDKHGVTEVGQRGFKGRFGTENRITKVEYPVYLFTNRYHVIVHGPNYYVYNYNSFDALFRSPADAIPKVSKMVSRISSVLELNDGADKVLIEIAAKKKSIANKLDALTRHIDQIKPTPDKIKNALSILERNQEEYFVENQLNFTEDNTEALLRVLNEDFFRGLISNTVYTADRKTAGQE
jgi:hypothetical protein